MAARTRVNATTTKLVNKKTLTITTTGNDAKGQNIDSVAVYDKQ